MGGASDAIKVVSCLFDSPLLLLTYTLTTRRVGLTDIREKKSSNFCLNSMEILIYPIR